MLHTTTRRCDEELLLSIRSAATIAIRKELIVGKRVHIVIILEHKLLLRGVRRTVELALRSYTIDVIHLRCQRLLLVSKILMLLVDHLCCRR